MDEHHQLHEVLKQAGIASCPIDPSSLQALKGLLREKRLSAGDGTVGKTPEGQSSAPTLMPPTAVSNSADPTGSQVSAQTASNSSVELSDLLEVMKLQTRVLYETQRKIDVLTDKVEAMERLQKSLPSQDTSSNDKEGEAASSDAIPQPSRVYVIRNQVLRRAAQDQAQVRFALGGRDPRVAAREQDNPPAAARPPQTVLAKLLKILTLFWRHSRGFVRPLDGPMLFKLVFLFMVFSARLSQRSSYFVEESGVSWRFRMSLLFMVGGFLWHLKYPQYLYHFFVKENIPARVWAGEWDGQDGVDVHAPQERQPRHEGQQEQQAPNPGIIGVQPRNGVGNLVEPGRGRVPPLQPVQEQEPAGFWRGVIAPRNDNANPLVTVVQDIFYLFASFVASIFPMWQLNPPRPAQREPPQNEARREGEGRGVIAAQPRAEQRIPEVAPPPNAMVPEDSSSSSEDDGSEDVDDNSSTSDGEGA